MNVRRVQAGLATVASRPARPRSDQAHAGATGVVVHLPGHVLQQIDVFRGEKIRRALRSVQHAQRPFMGDLWPGSGSGADRRGGRARLAQAQHITRGQRATGMATEPAEGEGRAAVQVDRHIDAACKQQVAAQAGAADAAELQGLAGVNQQWRVRLDADTVDARLERRAGQTDARRTPEQQHRTVRGELQARGIRRVAQQPVADAKAQGVHGPAGRHPHIPVALTARMILHARRKAAAQLPGWSAA